MEKKRKKALAILGALKNSEGPMSSSKISEQLATQGYDVSERTVRLYLQEMDEQGLTINRGKRGRQLTDEGLREIDNSDALDRVGFLSSKIDQMIFKMSFDLASRSGTVVVNITLVEPRQLIKHIDLISKVFEDGFAMGQLTTILKPEERCENLVIPDNMVGIGTVCSITLNGVLLKCGIPMHSKFGGLLELRNGKPTRFVEIIMYDGTTIDPLEVFIRSAMTDYVGAVTIGTGKIGASFREIPSESRERVLDLAQQLESIKLGGFMTIGVSGQPVLEIPVNEGRAGAILIGGLNPVAILEEKGVRIHSKALAGLMEYSHLFHHEELRTRVKEFI